MSTTSNSRTCLATGLKGSWNTLITQPSPSINRWRLLPATLSLLCVTTLCTFADDLSTHGARGPNELRSRAVQGALTPPRSSGRRETVPRDAGAREARIRRDRVRFATTDSVTLEIDLSIQPDDDQAALESFVGASHIRQASARFSLIRFCLAIAFSRLSSSSTPSAVPKYIPSGIWPRNAE
jgi:hypothetical protein